MKTVLVVDDEYALLETVRELLEYSGYAVVTARDGKEALERLERDPLPDVVISDVMMPVVDAYAFLADKSERAKIANIPVILMSAIPGDVVLGRLPEGSNVVGFLRKPFGAGKLLAMLAEVVADEPGNPSASEP